MKESEVRDYLCSNFKNFHKYITNIKEFKDDIKKQKQEIYEVTQSIEISDLVKLVLMDKVLNSTKNIEFYNLIDSEFQLLGTGAKRGKQPSIDILSYNTSSSKLALIELKISNSTEREAITELSAYNLGLQNKFQGLSNLQVIWIPISTDWRTTLFSAIEFSILWKNIQSLPLKLDIISNEGQIQNLNLTIINPIREIKELDYKNLFSYECFDTFEYFTMAKVKNKNGFINYLTTLFNRQNINGIVIFHKKYSYAQYPYGFTLCIYNPYKGYLHKKLLKEIVEENPDLDYYSIIKDCNLIDTNFHDVDFKSDELKFYQPTEKDLDGNSLRMDASWEKDFLSVGNFIDPEDDPNLDYLVHNLMEAIDSSQKNHRAFGTPNFEIFFKELENIQISYVSYLGLYHDLMSKKIHIEHKKKIHKKDFFNCLTSFAYLKKTFKLFNGR